MASAHCSLKLVVSVFFSISTCALGGAPAYLWSDVKSANFDHLSTESVKSAVDFASGLFGGIQKQNSAKYPDEISPRIVFAYISKLLNSDHLQGFEAGSEETNPLNLLKSHVKQASSSLLVPGMKSGPEEPFSAMEKSLMRSFKANFPEGQTAIIGECQTAHEGAVTLESVDEINAFLDANNEVKGPHFVVFCSNPSKASSDEESLREEVSAFQRAYAAVISGNMPHIALFTSESDSIPARPTRSLLTATSNTTESPSITYLKIASYYEVTSVAIVLLITLLSGLLCLAGIDSPTRFEPPRDA